MLEGSKRDVRDYEQHCFLERQAVNRPTFYLLPAILYEKPKCGHHKFTTTCLQQTENWVEVVMSALLDR